MPWIATGVFIYQSFLAEAKFWGIYVVPKSFMIYSLTSIITLVISGFLVDKFTSRRLIIFMNIPLLLGLILLYLFDQPLIAYLFFGFMGISNGLANVMGSSTWAEIYGVRYLGGIKALTTSLMVFSTAFGTALFGVLIDSGFLLDQIMMICISYIVLSLFLLFGIRGSIKPEYITKKA